MKYLLDTHVLLWALLESNKINPKVTSIIENPENQIFISTLSFWEISLKYSLGKIDLKNTGPNQFPDLALAMGFQILDLNAEVASNFHQLKGEWHKDPFDKLLIILAIRNNLTLITKDENIAKYKNEGLKVLW